MRDRLLQTDDLPLTALRYAAGDLPAAAAAAFEDRLAHDQAAQEALGEAIRLSAAALDRPALAPDPLVREAVREALRPTLLSWLFPRRPYRGHPLAWAGLGGVVAAGLTALGVWLGDQPADGTFPTGIADVAPLETPDLGVPAALKLAETPELPDEMPSPRPQRDDRSAAAEPATEPESSGRAVATDAEEKTAPGRSTDGKAVIEPEPGSR
jgi:hypothetical protein